MRCAAIPTRAVLAALLAAAVVSAQTSGGHHSKSTDAASDTDIGGSSAADDNHTSVGNPADGCPAAEPNPITCDDGQDSVYIPETSLMCAHYSCPPPKTSKPGGSNSNSNSSPKSTVLAAVLGSVIPALLIAAGIAFYLHRRHTKRRSLEAHHQDAKYMSSYNNLEENAFGGTMQPPGAFLSQHAGGGEWADPDPHGSGAGFESRASIPIIFSADLSGPMSAESRGTQLFAGEKSPAYRETRLYSRATSGGDAHQWAAPSVVNLAQGLQMPQIAHLPSSRPTTAAGADAGAAEDDIANSAAGVAAVSQMPRIIQISRPQSTYASSAQSSQDPPPGEVSRSAAHASWENDSDSDLDLDTDSGSNDDGNDDNNDDDGDSGDSDSDGDSITSGALAVPADPHPELAPPETPLTVDTQLDFETSLEGSFSRDIFGSSSIFDDSSPAKQQ